MARQSRWIEPLRNVRSRLIESCLMMSCSSHLSVVSSTIPIDPLVPFGSTTPVPWNRSNLPLAPGGW
jgi:hypothetical protein